MFMVLNVNVSVRVGGWPLKFPVRVAVILYWSGCQVVVLMLMNSSVSVVFSFIVISRVVWFTLCVVLVMLSVRLVMFMWFRVMLNVVSSVSFGPMFDESVALNLNVLRLLLLWGFLFGR